MQTIIVRLSLALAIGYVITALWAYTHTQRWEDGSIVVQSPYPGIRWVYDPDGQPFTNDAGVPIRSPGWYTIVER